MRSSLAVIIAATVTAMALLAGGCSRPAPKATSARPSALPAQSDYASPPQPTTASRGRDGEVNLTGVSRPDALIRLASPDGTATGVAATHNGVWTLTTSVGDQPRLFSLAEDMNGRPLRAAGYIATLPASAPAAAMLRPGMGAQVLGGAPGPLSIAAIDFDGGGAAVVSGKATPGATVRLTLDGAEAGEDRADAGGIFSVSASPALRPGPHLLEAITTHARSSQAFEAARARTLAKPPFTAAHTPVGWRIDWMTPGGGIQTTILFESSEAAP